MNYLVTGGFGQLGSFFVDLIESVEPNSQVVVVDNLSAPKHQTSWNGVVHKNVDIRNYDALSDVFNEFTIHKVLHFAAQISVPFSVSNPLEDASNNIIGSINVLETAKNAEVKDLVAIGSAATIGVPEEIPVTEEASQNPISPYGLSKLATERYTIQYANLYNLNYNVVRPFNAYSSRMKAGDSYAGVITKFIEFVRNGQSMVIEGDGLQTRDFIYGKDVAKIAHYVISNNYKGKLFNAATGVQTSILELSKIIAEAFDVKWDVQFVEERHADIKHSLGTPPLFMNEFTSVKRGISEIISYMNSKSNV